MEVAVPDRERSMVASDRLSGPGLAQDRFRETQLHRSAAEQAPTRSDASGACTLTRGLCSGACPAFPLAARVALNSPRATGPRRPDSAADGAEAPEKRPGGAHRGPSTAGRERERERETEITHIYIYMYTVTRDRGSAGWRLDRVRGRLAFRWVRQLPVRVCV